ncbi:hypothetical protein N7478_004403 [Penicillium angulare]|uniref:uncharacterized protein n=1 Tax=Penicillium angulare TaxID=116970 RepID=UPI0025422E24|nr:uncharacterized protein N7478_004403 [Penicillium angulare]KAJ5279031.1 hypothetical protein N7478_004403 [Penicillium angulare]
MDTLPTSPFIGVPRSTGAVVVLNGFPGTGKLTILKQVKQQLPVDRTIMLDNHLLIDPVSAVVPDRSDKHHELRRTIRAPIFQKLRQRAHNGYIILMTACLAEDNATDSAFLEEHLDIMRMTDVPIIWLNPHYGQATLGQRLLSSERGQGSKTELMDICMLRDLLCDNRLIQPHKSTDGSVKLVVKTLNASRPSKKVPGASNERYSVSTVHSNRMKLRLQTSCD